MSGDSFRKKIRGGKDKAMVGGGGRYLVEAEVKEDDDDGREREKG
jgi:hypothetical protein